MLQARDELSLITLIILLSRMMVLNFKYITQLINHL